MCKTLLQSGDSTEAHATHGTLTLVQRPNCNQCYMSYDIFNIIIPAYSTHGHIYIYAITSSNMYQMDGD